MEPIKIASSRRSRRKNLKAHRLKKFTTYEEANEFMREQYLPRHNSKYAVAPREKADYHQALGSRLDLNQVFCLENERKVTNDWVVQYDNRWLQIEKEGQKTQVHAGAKVVVREHRDGTLTLLLDGKALRWHELAERPRKAAPVTKRRVLTRSKPAAEHPWRKPIKAPRQQ